MADCKPIQSVVRASQIIDCFSESRPELGLADFCSLLSLNKSTIYGIVKTLEHEKYLIYNPSSRKYRLGIKFVTKGLYAITALNTVSIVSPYLMKLNTKYQETANFVLYENDTLYCIYALGSSFLTSMKTEIGSELPLLASASGKAVLATMDDDTVCSFIAGKPFLMYTPHSVQTKDALLEQLKTIRQCGYAIENEEIDLGIQSISVAIRNSEKVIGTISLTGPVNHMKQIHDELTTDIMICGKKISSTLGCTLPG